jgi:hypothetical protein
VLVGFGFIVCLQKWRLQVSKNNNNSYELKKAPQGLRENADLTVLVIHIVVPQLCRTAQLLTQLQQAGRLPQY